MQLKNLADEVALVLPDDLLWSDEHSWSPTVATSAYLITGALLIQSAMRLAGRPITLIGAPDIEPLLSSSMCTAVLMAGF